MEKVSVTVSIEKERFEALTFYLHRKEQTTPLKILEKMLMEMYEKHVPQDTREYIDSRLKPVPVAKVKPKKRETAPKEEVKANGIEGNKPVDRRALVQSPEQTSE